MSEITGIVNINKPAGLTSYQVVAEVKKILSCKKAGHTGTLDPAAKGVLPVCLGKATKIIPFIPEEEKEYLATITLGQTTDTLDAEGKILEENEGWPQLGLRDIEMVLQKFIGDIEQIPPMYSAVHHEGIRLYQLAREGKEVERKPRQVQIKELELLDVELPQFKIRVLCSPGTYIRTLAADIGEELQVGAHLSELIRSKSGPFSINKAVSLDELRNTGRENILPADYPLNYPMLYIKEEALNFARNGVTLYRHNFREIPAELRKDIKKDRLVSVYYEDILISISKIFFKDNNHFECKPLRVLNIERSIQK